MPVIHNTVTWDFGALLIKWPSVSGAGVLCKSFARMDTLGHGKFSRVFFRAEQGAELAVAQIKPVLRGLSKFAQFVLVSN